MNRAVLAVRFVMRAYVAAIDSVIDSRWFLYAKSAQKY